MVLSVVKDAGGGVFLLMAAMPSHMLRHANLENNPIPERKRPDLGLGQST